MSLFRRYGPGAPFYDVLSGERLVYRIGRVAAVDALDLSAGQSVLDIGCGTGLNFPLLLDRVGPEGLVVGVDRSPEMLEMARRRAVRHGWNNVRLVRADLTTLSAEALAAKVGGIRSSGSASRFGSASQPGAASRSGSASSSRSASQPGAPPSPREFDRAIATYALSVFDDWHPAWNLMREALRPGGRIAVVDMARPVGLGALLTPLALAACATGGADIDAAPWRDLERTGADVTHSTFRAGHIHVVTGSFP